jgi:hypothetical protein
MLVGAGTAVCASGGVSFRVLRIVILLLMAILEQPALQAAIGDCLS